ncbi:MAG: hypothetical protein Q9227_001970 [Pyrenula ochraceoflavens]
MRFQQDTSGGSAIVDEGIEKSSKPREHSSSLPFSQPVTLSSLCGPSYVTAQVLIQQVAFLLSDKIFSYSPETFDLDLCAKEWSLVEGANIHGHSTDLQSLDTRSGAGSLVLGYLFSRDFDVQQRHVPQSVIASTSSLKYLRHAFEQLSLLQSTTNPLVAHIAAVDYDGSKDGVLVTDYTASMALAEDLGFGMICARSAYEAQHMAILSTVLAGLMPTVHIMDGVHTVKETTRVIDVLDRQGLSMSYNSIKARCHELSKKNMSQDNKALQLLQAFNEEMGTEYKAFEYTGHKEPTVVLVCFGSVESSLAAQIASSLAKDDVRVGVVSVRLYRPFSEQLLLDAFPKTTQTVGVLGQVHNEREVQSPDVHSRLYNDVLPAITMSAENNLTLEIQELKYSRSHIWNPVSIAAAFQFVLGKPLLQENEQHRTPSLQILDDSAREYVFWDHDDSLTAAAGSSVAQTLSEDNAQNVTANIAFDNLIEGGIRRTDIRSSPRSLEASFSVDAADVAFVGNVKILERINVVQGIKDGGCLIVNLPNFKDDSLDKKFSAGNRKRIAEHNISLHILDITRSDYASSISDAEFVLAQIAFLRCARLDFGPKIITSGLLIEVIEKLSETLENTLLRIDAEQLWSEGTLPTDEDSLPSNLVQTSFVRFEKDLTEPPSLLRDWQKAAKGVVFREAYNTTSALRPDVATQTYTVHVQENRRLTPLTYDRNIFHIEFALGDSGLKYDIGEALGVHAENDPDEVTEFIKFYGLNPDDIVEVPSREDPSIFENRTVWQSLLQNIDIFGRPPKRFYESLATFADNEDQRKELLALAGPEGAVEFKRRGEVDTVTYADILLEFPSAHPSFHDIARIVSPMKRREYSIASCQKVTPDSVALMVVVVGWVDPKGRDRFGQATRFMSKLTPGTAVTVSIKPSVMKLPPKSTQPLIMAGLGTGLAPFRAFVQHRALEKAQGKDIGSVLLYMGSRHQREEYCYGEEWEAYQDAGVITLLGRAFSRDQPQKIYIQDRMRQTLSDIIQAYMKEEGAFYLCGPTWPVPDVTNVLEEAIATHGKAMGKKLDGHKEIEKLKDEGRYVLEVY